jgi:hypothetical protein
MGLFHSPRNEKFVCVGHVLKAKNRKLFSNWENKVNLVLFSLPKNPLLLSSKCQNGTVYRVNEYILEMFINYYPL